MSPRILEITTGVIIETYDGWGVSKTNIAFVLINESKPLIKTSSVNRATRRVTFTLFVLYIFNKIHNDGY